MSERREKAIKSNERGENRSRNREEDMVVPPSSFYSKEGEQLMH